MDYIETTNIKTLNIETTPVVPKTPLRKAVEVEHPNKNSQTVDNSNNTNDVNMRLALLKIEKSPFHVIFLKSSF